MSTGNTRSIPAYVSLSPSLLPPFIRHFFLRSLLFPSMPSVPVHVISFHFFGLSVRQCFLLLCAWKPTYPFAANEFQPCIESKKPSSTTSGETLNLHPPTHPFPSTHSPIHPLIHFHPPTHPSTHSSISIHPLIHSPTHPLPCTNSSIHPLIHAQTHPSTHSSIHTLINPPTHPSTHSSIHPLIHFHSPTHPSTHSSTHSSIHPLIH